MAYQHLPAVTYSVLNQTKTLMAAIFCYLLLGQSQSAIQIGALALLVLSALIIEGIVKLENPTTWMIWKHAAQHLSIFSDHRGKPKSTHDDDDVHHRDQKMTTNQKDTSRDITEESGSDDSVAKVPAANEDKNLHFSRGIVPLLVANSMSELAAAWSQGALQQNDRNLYLYGMEISGASLIMTLLSLCWSKDGQRLQREGMAKYCKSKTMIPVAAYAVGGVLLAAVTKYAGAVEKGFATILGVFFSGLLQSWISEEAVTKEQIIGGILACTSLWMHSSYPPSVTA